MTKLGVFLLFIVAIIFTIGSLMVYNTTSAEVIDKALDYEMHTAFIKQLIFGGFGLVLAYLAVYFGHEKIFEYSPWILLFLVFLLICVFIPGVGQQLNGAKRWVKILGTSFQPSEFVKIFLPMALLKYLSLQPVKSFFHFVRLLIVVSCPIFLILMEPDNGTCAILMVTLMVIFFLVGINKRYWMVPFFILLAIGAGIASRMPHVLNRIEIYLHPEKDLLGKGHQPYQAKIALGSGQLFGRGMGNSIQKLTYLPEARSDYIAAIYAEEFGFIGVLFLISLYLLVALIGFKIALSANKQIPFYLSVYLTFLIVFQAFLNLGVVSGLLPSKGTNLPFFSQGGSSLTANFFIIGLLIDMTKVRWTKENEFYEA